VVGTVNPLVYFHFMDQCEIFIDSLVTLTLDGEKQPSIFVRLEAYILLLGKYSKSHAEITHTTFIIQCTHSISPFGCFAGRCRTCSFIKRNVIIFEFPYVTHLRCSPPNISKLPQKSLLEHLRPRIDVPMHAPQRKRRVFSWYLMHAVT
jgi:hypothetical protein